MYTDIHQIIKSSNCFTKQDSILWASCGWCIATRHIVVTTFLSWRQTRCVAPSIAIPPLILVMPVILRTIVSGIVALRRTIVGIRCVVTARMAITALRRWSIHVVVSWRTMTIVIPLLITTMRIPITTPRIEMTSLPTVSPPLKLPTPPILPTSPSNLPRPPRRRIRSRSRPIKSLPKIPTIRPPIMSPPRVLNPAPRPFAPPLHATANFP